MKNMSCRSFLCLAVSAIFFLLASPGHATLGGPADSVEADRKMLSASRGAITTQGSYTVHAMADDAHTYREYVSASGVVFAIAWDGLFAADLTPLLGSYEGEFQQALSNTPHPPGMRNRSVVRTPRVVVEQWGHMRSMHGRAYVPDLIPPGVSLDEIK